jgi:hypothetical protein
MPFFTITFFHIDTPRFTPPLIIDFALAADTFHAVFTTPRFSHFRLSYRRHFSMAPVCAAVFALFRCFFSFFDDAIAADISCQPFRH